MKWRRSNRETVECMKNPGKCDVNSKKKKNVKESWESSEKEKKRQLE